MLEEVASVNGKSFALGSEFDVDVQNLDETGIVLQAKYIVYFLSSEIFPCTYLMVAPSLEMETEKLGFLFLLSNSSGRQ